MTPKEKAEELVDKFNLPSGLMSIERKQCALIAVDEIICNIEDDYMCTEFQYWQEVKQEIEKL
jgi:hypothetical protein